MLQNIMCVGRRPNSELDLKVLHELHMNKREHTRASGKDERGTDYNDRHAC